MIKRCTGCKQEKAFQEFNKCKSGKFGLHNHCRVCQKKCRQKYYLNNREKEKTYQKTYGQSQTGIENRKKNYIKNKDKLLAINRKLRATPHARKLANIARKKKLETDVGFRMSQNLRNRVRVALKGATKSQHTLDLLGCSIEFFKSYLEAKFLPGMTWDNYGYYGWHLDHILPCDSFDLTNPKEQEKCFHSNRPFNNNSFRSVNFRMDQIKKTRIR
jgi:hypothetical protein